MERLVKLILAKLKQNEISKAAAFELLSEMKSEMSSSHQNHIYNQDVATGKTVCEDIAVIGLACRFPDADTPEKFWNNLTMGKDSIREFPKERWPHEDFYSSDRSAPGKSYSKWGGFIADMDQFASSYFQIPVEEAMLIDPQQRLFLEVASETLQRAGYSRKYIWNSRTAVFVGARASTYRNHRNQSADTFRANITGNITNFIAARVSDYFSLKGPSLTIDTACSSSLVAIHYAIKSILSGESEMALAGGVELKVTPWPYVTLCSGKALSVNGKSYVFDARADGFVPGEGAGAVLLKPLSKALEDGDTIYAVIKGSAVNNDGYTMGITTPNFEGQKEVLREAFKIAGITPDTISYIEAHGTGTMIGDPIEIKALTEIFREATLKEGFCAVGSVKTNIGHLDTAAGIAGFIKTVLCLYNKKLVPTLNCEIPNPRLNLISTPFYPNTRLSDWEPINGCRRAGVSSFGFGGTNCHIVLEENHLEQPSITEPLGQCSLFTISAGSEKVLRYLLDEYIEHLEKDSDVSIGDICFTANAGRESLPERLALAVNDKAQLLEKMKKLKDTTPFKNIGDTVFYGSKKGTKKNKVAFIFPGQGSQYKMMAKVLYDTQPVFRNNLDRCSEILQNYMERPLLDYLYNPDTDGELLNKTSITQPALFSIGYSLAAMWESWGIKPGIILGHSVGEYVAACVAGVFSLEDGLRLISIRSRLMQELPSNGGMAAIFADRNRVRGLIGSLSGKEKELISIAACNGPSNTVVAGDLKVLDKIVQSAESLGITYTMLKVSHAFHSPLMRPVLDEFSKALDATKFNRLKLPLVSNVSGTVLNKVVLDKEYWLKHIMEPVMFEEGIKSLLSWGCNTILETGPSATLLGMVRKLIDKKSDVLMISTLNKGMDDWNSICSAAAGLYANGMDIDFSAFYNGQRHRHVRLPVYPLKLEHESCWVEQRVMSKAESNVNESNINENNTVNKVFTIEKDLVLKNHIVLGTCMLPGVCLWEIAMEAAEAEGIGACGIAEVTHLLPVRVLPGEEMEVQATASKENNSFVIESRKAGSGGKWNCNVSGKYVTGTMTKVPPLDVKALRECIGNSVVSSEEVYRMFFERGVEYGGFFRSIAEISGDRHRTLARLELTKDALDADYKSFYHPSIFDGALQTVIGLTSDEDIDGGNTYVPFFAEKIEYFEHLENKCLAFLEVRSSSREVLKADISIIDESGKVLAKITGFTLKKVPVKDNKPQKSLEKHYLYNIDWKEESLSEETFSSRCKLIFFKNCEKHNLLVEDLSKNNVHSISVYQGRVRLKKDENTYEIDMEQPEDYVWIFNQVAHRQLDGIIYLMAYGETENALSDIESLETYHQYTTISFMNLVRAVPPRHFKKGIDIQIVTEGVYAVERNDCCPMPEKAVLAGLAKSVGLEYGYIRCRIVDSKGGTDLTNNVLMNELKSSFGPQVVAIRGEKRYTTLIREVQGKLEEPVRPLIRENGVYIITGGLNGLGFEIAKIISSKTKAQLFLLSRSGFLHRSEWDHYLSEHKSADAICMKITSLKAMEEQGSKINVIRADVSSLEHMRKLAEFLKEKGLRPDGIFHCAGVLRDGLVMAKSIEDFKEVYRPKITGTYALWKAFDNFMPDYVIYFSSIASVFGSLGQGDYSAANSFLDSYAHWANRQGKTRAVSINWTMWKDVGMGIRTGQVEANAMRGIKPIDSKKAFESMEKALNSGLSQVIILNNDIHDIDKTDTREETRECIPDAQEKLSSVSKEEITDVVEEKLSGSSEFCDEDIRLLMEEMLVDRISGILDIDRSEISTEVNFLELGLDSVRLVDLTGWLGEMAGANIYPTLLFEYSTVKDLAGYLADEHGVTLLKRYDGKGEENRGNLQVKVKSDISIENTKIRNAYPVDGKQKPESIKKAIEFLIDFSEDTVLPKPGSAPVKPVPVPNACKYVQQKTQADNHLKDETDIAIIGIYGKFPKSQNIYEYWDNCKKGINAISEYPDERFAGTIYANDFKGIKGAFIDEIDKFDPLFFNISPREVEYMDPQQRLFLEAAWSVLEMGGYNKDRLKKIKAGVFVGASQVDYKGLWNETQALSPYLGLGNSLCVIANRVSYLLNLKGPSMILDTACSSSLVAVHMACNSLFSGESDIAIAGGVQLYLSQQTFKIFDMAGMLSKDAKCKTFDNNADGYVRGEGVGAVLLKPLHKALEDGDIIHAVIKGSSVNHDGNDKVGVSAPNPKAQKEVILSTLKRAGVTPDTIGYIEAHGTGTSLGDPVELGGLTQAYREYTDKNAFCAIGSAKSLVGHMEAAAGIGGLLRVVMALKDKKLPMTLNVNVPNRNVPFEQTPFYINDSTKHWERDLFPRRAGVSAFGFGGTNCHVILEEYEEKEALEESVPGPGLLALSAKSVTALEETVKNLVHYLDNNPDVKLMDVCFSSITGRNFFNARACVYAESIAQMRDRLEIILLKGIENAANPYGIFYNNTEIFKSSHNAILLGDIIVKDVDILKEAAAFDTDGMMDTCLKSLGINTLQKLGELLEKDSGDYSRKVAAFILQYTLTMKFISMGFEPDLLVCKGIGNITAAMVNGLIGLDSLPEILREGTYIHKGKGRVECISLGNLDGTNHSYCLPNKKVDFVVEISSIKLLENTASINIDKDRYLLVQCENKRIYSSLLMAAGSIFTKDVDFELEHLYDGKRYKRLTLPGYPFQKKSFWLKIPKSDGVGKVKSIPDRDNKKLPELPSEKQNNGLSCECFYGWDWVKAPSDGRVRNKGINTWVLLGNEDSLTKAVKASLLQKGGKVITAVGGREFSILSNDCYEIAPSNTEHYYRLFDSIGIKEGEVLGIVHLWTCESMARELDGLHETERTLEKGLYSVFHIGKVLSKVKNTVELYVATSCSYMVTGREKNVRAENAALGIGAASLAMERANMDFKCLDFCLEDMTIQQMAEAINEEISKGINGQGYMAFRAGNRWMKSLVKKDIGKVSSDKIALKPGGVYLITGGATGVGFHISKYLAEKCSPTLIIAGRSRLPLAEECNEWMNHNGHDKKVMERLENVATLEALCSEVIYKAVDVADISGMKHLIDEVSARFGRLDGVIHCAGIIDDGQVAEKSIEEFKSVIYPKIYGTLALDKLIKKLNPDFLILTSSITALYGNAGQVGYAAANAFMDSLAAMCSSARHCISINWSYWIDGGMKTNSSALRRMTQLGLNPMSTETALEAFGQLLDNPAYNNIAVMAMDQNTVSKKQKSAVETKENSIKEFLLNLMGRLLLIDPGEFGMDTRFDNYGIDSLIIQDAVKSIEDFLEQAVEPSIFMDYPTIHMMSQYLSSNYHIPIKIIPVRQIDYLENEVHDNHKTDTNNDPKTPQREENPKDSESKASTTDVENHMKQERLDILKSIAEGRLDRKTGMEKLLALGGKK